MAALAERWDDEEDLRAGFWAPVLEDLERRHPDGVPRRLLDCIADSIAGDRPGT